MKTILLAGGLGTRISEETQARPKPMVEIGGKPILCHIMGIYAHYGYNDFAVACGYKGECIKAYFSNLHLHFDDCVVDFRNSSRSVLKEAAPDWRVSLVDTGLKTMTGGRIKRLRDLIGDETFMVTYGDGVSNVDIRRLVEFHRASGRLATVTAVRPPARFGGLVLDGDEVKRFAEKNQADAGWINGGFFVFEPAVFDYIHDDRTSLELEPLERLADDGQLVAYKHYGFWQPMDTLREKQLLESLWDRGEAPWDPANLEPDGDESGTHELEFAA